MTGWSAEDECLYPSLHKERVTPGQRVTEPSSARATLAAGDRTSPNGAVTRFDEFKSRKRSMLYQISPPWSWGRRSP